MLGTQYAEVYQYGRLGMAVFLFFHLFVKDDNPNQEALALAATRTSICCWVACAAVKKGDQNII
jgi:hypothetical protein